MKIAFVCNGNSFKSIIGEFFGNKYNNGSFEIFSAGTKPANSLNKDGKEIMEGYNYSLEGYKPQSMETLPTDLDILVKMGCDIECPIYSAKKIINFGLENIKDKKECIKLIEEKVKELFNELGGIEDENR